MKTTEGRGVPVSSGTIRSVVKAFFGTLIFAGLPVLGWGPREIGGFLADPGRTAYTGVSVALQIVIALAFPSVGSGRREGRETVRRQRVALVLLQVVSPLILIAGGYTDRRDLATIEGPEMIRYLGVGLYAFGLLLGVWAESILGKQFSVQITIQAGHELVTRGPYRRIRHPRYLGILVFAVGASLSFDSWPALGLVGLLALVLLWRIHDEEGLMHRQFGEQWEAYARRSWRLIPGVY